MKQHAEDRRAASWCTSDPDLHTRLIETMDWEMELDCWLAPFADALGDTRRPWASLYLRGLMGASARKSVEPLTAQGHADLAAHPPMDPAVPHTVHYHQSYVGISRPC